MSSTATVICEACGKVSTNHVAYLKHRSQQHSEPIPVTLPDGSVETVQQADGGKYICWCKKLMGRRDTCINHVANQHLAGDKSIAIFKERTGEAAVSTSLVQFCS